MKIDYKELKKYFAPTEQLFNLYKKNCLDYDNKDKRRIFFDNGGKILLVAHLDTVQKPQIKKIKQNRIIGSGFDDRAGLWIIYEILKRGIKADILLTDNEEKAQSTAKFHNCKKYNWIAEFDRQGTDFVDYSAAPPEMISAAKEFWPYGFGSFSDICSLKTDAASINIGTAYYYAHSKDSVLKTDEFYSQIEKFCRFYQKYQNENWKKEEKHFGFNWNAYRKKDDYYHLNADPITCDYCKEEKYTTRYEAAHDSFLCLDCRRIWNGYDEAAETDADALDRLQEEESGEEEIRSFNRLCDCCQTEVYNWNYNKNTQAILCDNCNWYINTLIENREAEKEAAQAKERE